MSEIANVRLALPGRAENVLVVRQALTGLAGVLALDAIETNDINTAVTEACNNVIVHAYGGEEGPLELDVYVLGRTLAVAVRDHGVGMPAGDASEGMGLAVIAALAGHVAFNTLPAGGTEVRMEFPLREQAPFALQADPLAGPEPLRRLASVDDRASAVEVWLTPSALARAILPRVLTALAARAHFSTDRIADVQTLAGALAAGAMESVNASHLAVGVTVSPRKLALRIGPLRAGRAESLVAAAANGLARLTERLSDATAVAAAGSGETLEVQLVDRR